MDWSEEQQEIQNLTLEQIDNIILNLISKDVIESSSDDPRRWLNNLFVFVKESPPTHQVSRI
jgi:hypothetical protein